MSFDIDLLGPPEEDENALAHYGVKGMRWGHTTIDESSDSSSSSKSNSSSSSSSSSGGGHEGLTDGQKKALKYAAGGALVAGALIGTAVLAKNGKLPIGSLKNLNPNSLAAETRRMEKIPGTLAYQSKLAKTPGSLAAETARMAKIPGTIANREAQLASAARSSATMKPEVRAQFMQRVNARLDAESARRTTVQMNRARLIAENAQRDAFASSQAARRQIVSNQGRALTRSGDRNPIQGAVDGVTTRIDSRRATRAIGSAADAQQRAQAATEKKNEGPSRMENVQTLIKAAAMGREAINSVRSSPMWNQPAASLSTTPTPTQRQQIVAAQRRAAENQRQNESRRGRN